MDKILAFFTLLTVCSVQISAQRQFSLKNNRTLKLINKLRLPQIETMETILDNGAHIIDTKCIANTKNGKYSCQCCQNAKRAIDVQQAESIMNIEKCISEQLVIMIKNTRSESAFENGLIPLVTLARRLFGSTKIKNLILQVDKDLSTCFGNVMSFLELSLMETDGEYDSCALTENENKHQLKNESISKKN